MGYRYYYLGLILFRQQIMRPSSAKYSSFHQPISQGNQPYLQKQQRQTPILEPKVRTLETSVIEKKINHQRPSSASGKSNRDNHQSNPEASLRQTASKKQQINANQQSQKRVKTQHASQKQSQANSQRPKSRDGECFQKLLSQTKHHDPYLCVCSNCTCGRHVCKIHPYTKPSLQSSSTYQKQFTKKNPFDSINFQAMGAYKDDNPVVDPTSMYTKDYPPKAVQLSQKVLPVPCLKVGGPSSSLTSYGSGFPGYQPVAAQPIIQKGGQIINGVKLNAQTTYSREYGSKNPKPVQVVKGEDNLKSGNIWICGSTYGETYKAPNKTFSSNWKSKVSKAEEPKYANQFNTTYRNEYGKNELEVCPAKTELQTRQRFFSNSRLQTLKKQRKEAEKSFRMIL